MTPSPIDPPDLNTLPLEALYAELTRTGLVHRLLELARDEDLGPPRTPRTPGTPGALDASEAPGTQTGDVTSCLTVGDAPAEAALVAREPMVVAGCAALPAALAVLAPAGGVQTVIPDGQRAAAGDTIALLRGPARELLIAERTLLNLLSRLCGVATRTAEFVQRVQGTGAGVYDTRKTTPGLRVLEKYAVRCGGGMCHRLGLYDALLIKDNHLAGVPTAVLADRVSAAVRAARADRSLRFVMVEVDTLEQLGAVLTLDEGEVDIVLLDNMPPETLREAVRRRAERDSKVVFEASGGVTLETIRPIAETGVERISVGSLTRGAVSPDIGMDRGRLEPGGLTTPAAPR